MVPQVNRTAQRLVKADVDICVAKRQAIYFRGEKIVLLQSKPLICTAGFAGAGSELAVYKASGSRGVVVADIEIDVCQSVSVDAAAITRQIRGIEYEAKLEGIANVKRVL